jgi:hypothetical protein
MSANNRTMRNLRLKPGAAFFKKTLNNRKPKIVSTSNLFPGSQTPRPTINISNSVKPAEVSTQSLFSDPKQPSAFNMEPKNLRLRNRQAKAVRASEGKNTLVFPMNHSFGGETGGRRRKNKRTRKHRR